MVSSDRSFRSQERCTQGFRKLAALKFGCTSRGFKVENVGGGYGGDDDSDDGASEEQDQIMATMQIMMLFLLLTLL